MEDDVAREDAALEATELERLSRNTPVVFRPFIIRTRFANGARMLVRCAEPVGL